VQAVLKGFYPLVVVPIGIALATLISVPPSPRVRIAIGLLCLLVVISCFVYRAYWLGVGLAALFLVAGSVGQAWRAGILEKVVVHVTGPGPYLVDVITLDKDGPSYRATSRGADGNLLVKIHGPQGKELVPGCLSPWIRLEAERSQAIQVFDRERKADYVERSCPFVFLDTNPDKARQVLRQAFLACCDDPAKMELVLNPVVTLHELAIRVEPDRQLVIPLAPELSGHLRGIVASLAPMERRRDGAIKTPTHWEVPHTVEVAG